MIARRYRWICGIILISSYLFFFACEEQFRPELEDFDPILVVDGSITNMPGPHKVRLTLSSGLLPTQQQAIENATVEIIEEGGDQESLTEEEPGYYTTTDGGIQGKIGHQYKLRIVLVDGTLYETEYQTLQDPIGIDSVGANLESQFVSIDEPDVLGYQFHVTTNQVESQENYFLWSLERMYKYEADLTIDYTYSGQINPYPNPNEFSVCWREDQINEIFTFNTAALSKPKVEQLPLHFERADEREISIRYSLLVKQFTINQEAYIFWNNLQRQIESQDNLYSTQPFQIRGNIMNMNNPDERVLGFFMVAGQTEKRIYVDRPAELTTEFSYCEPDYMSFGLIGLIHPAAWPIYIYEDEDGERGLGNDECFDCRVLGGTTTRPSFWED